MNTSAILLNRIRVRQPKKYDTYMSGKVVYDDDKMSICLRNVRLVSCKKANDTLYCQIKLGREYERFFMDLEEYIVGLTVDNVDAWFKSKMNKDTVDEYFVSGLTFSKKHRCVLKLRIDSPSCDISESWVGSNVDVVLRVSSLKFLKTTFWLSYDVVSCEESNLFVDEDDDNRSIVGGDDEGEDGPDHEEVERLRLKYMEVMTRSLGSMENRMQRLRDLYAILERNNFSMATFDAVENALSEIICDV